MIVEKSSMIKEYFDIYSKNIKEYGEKTCVLYENGAFFEIYQIDNENEKIGNASILSGILNNMTYTSKTIGKMVVNFIGFNTSCLDKFLPLLLDENYTVVIVNQLETNENRITKGNLKRGITKIYSSSLQPIDYKSGCLLHILFDISNNKTSLKKNATMINNINTSVCSINNEYNNIELSENSFNCIPNDINSLNQCLDELERILYRYFAKEIQVKIKYDKKDEDEIFWGMKSINDFFNNNFENVSIKDVNILEYKKYNIIDNQNAFMKEIYKHIEFGMLNPIEYMNLQNNNLSIINLMMTLEFVGRHDNCYLNNLNIPKLIVEDTNLILELNTVSQLNMINNSNNSTKSTFSSVFDVINHTKTIIGKRHLQTLLCKPFKTTDQINNRYIITEELRKICLDKLLISICDFEKLHRKMCLLQLHPYEFDKLNETYVVILEIIEILLKNCNLTILPTEIELNDFKEYMIDYTLKFDLNIMKKMDLNTGKDDIRNYFNKGIILELDIIQDKIDKIEEKREDLRIMYNNIIGNNSQFIKLMYSDNDGYSFTCTKIRYELLLKKEKSLTNCRSKQATNVVKFYPDDLLKLSVELLNLKELLHKKIKMHYFDVLKQYTNKYNYLFIILKELIEIIDVCNSNLKCSIKYNYTRPIIENSISASFEAIQIRHPIIERLGTNYIPNDIMLTNIKNGILLYGINSSGKSSLLRAIGINIILAQCGLYVPCSKFVFSPFDTIITQVDLTDNLFNGKSSYITEMMGLKKILKCSGSNTLVLCDEMCKGTENYSSISLVASTIKKLLDNNTKFFFTSHLHEIATLDEIDYKKLEICHLDITIKNDKDIFFNRILKSGSGSPLYGLEVAKSILEDPKLIDDAFTIRNKLIGNNVQVLSSKKSVYNRKKLIKKCEICNSTKNLEVDHIAPQQNTDINGFVNDSSFHKNEIFNLTVLCKKCHLKKTQGKIIIHGYKDTTNGKILEYI